MYEEELRVAVQSVREAGKILKENYGRPQKESLKAGDWHEVITETDKKADITIREIIESSFPSHSVSSEESLPKEGDSRTWYIDPLDGTTNYTAQIPFFCSAVGLFAGKKPVVSAVLNPATDELFAASGSSRATLNGKAIRVSDNTEIKKTIVNCCHSNTAESIRQIAGIFEQLKKEARDLRRLGSANLDICYVACGRNDIFFSDSKIWDIAPSVVLAKESGATITDWKGGEWNTDSPDIVVTNGHLHKYILEKLKGKQ